MNRVHRVEEAAEEFLRMSAAGEEPSESEFVSRHRDLMPELGEALRVARMIACARSRATTRAAVDTDSTTRGLPLDALDLEHLSFPGYESVERLKRGGQGIVYSAIQQGTNRRVAIKVLREGPFAEPRDRARFEREVELLRVLNHPGLVTVHASGITAGHFYYVMDYIEGVSLDVWAVRQGRSIPRTITCCEKVCDAVNAAHLRGVIHRDLKPGNILVDADEQPHILDFGLAKVVGGAGATVSETGHFVGSMPWASPEQTQGSTTAGVDIRTDVYSLGVLLFTLLTGRFPYEVGGGLRQIMDSIVNAEPIRPRSVRREIDGDLETIILQCLSKDPERRYQSAGELAKDLRRHRMGEPIAARRDSSWYMCRKMLRRHRYFMTAACVVILLMVGFGYVNHRESLRSQKLAHIVLNLFETDRNEGKVAEEDFAQRLDSKAARITAELEHEPKMQFTIMDATSDGLISLRDSKRAIPWLRKQLALSTGILKSDDQTVATLMIRLAKVLLNTGSFDEPQTLYPRAIQLLRGAADGSDEILAYALTEYGKCLGYYVGSHERGRQLLEEALDILRARFEGDHQLVAEQLYHLGNYTHNMSDFAGAVAYYRESLEMQQRLDPDRPTWRHKEWLGLVYKDMANLSGQKQHYADAQRFLDEAVREVQTTLGEDSGAMAYVLTSVAKLHADSGQYVLCEETCDRALISSSKTLGTDDRNTLTTGVLCARIRIELGRFEEAASILRPVIRDLDRLLPGHWETAKAKSLLGAALAGVAAAKRDDGQPEEAERMFEEAESLLVNAHPAILSDRGKSHYRTRESIERIVFLYDHWDKPALADEWRRLTPH